MVSARRFLNLAVLCAAGSLSAAGCVERTITIVTEPGEAQFTLDTDKVGLTTSPENDVDPKCSIRFDFYGTRTFVLEKPGYETLVVRKIVSPPLYEMPLIGFVAENLIPITLHDDHYFEFRLTPRAPVDETELLKRAEAMGRRVGKLPPIEEPETENK